MPALPLPAQAPPASGIGPDAWWNPLSPSWPPTAAGRALGQAARKRSAEAAETLEKAAGELQKKAGGMLPDPILAAEAIIGRPSWGYYVPTVAVGVASVAALAVVGAAVVRHQKRRRR